MSNHHVPRHPLPAPIGEDVIWTVPGLVIRGLVRLQPIGLPRLTRRGRRTLESPA